MTDAETATYLDTTRPFDQRAADLVGRMTLEEKVSQMRHEAPAIERLGVPQYDWWNECLHGVGRAGAATVFPQAIGLAATFDVELMGRIATAISDEARAKHHQALRQGNRGRYFGLTYWSPNVNIFRDPRWGRGQETYGEDPYLSGRMGVAFCRGLQGDDPKYLKLVATPKHYAVHSGPEPLRHGFDAVVGARDLRDTYLPAFQACVTEAKAYSIMGAYNRTNGEACCASKTLLMDILRGEWGFDGFVVSDCGAIGDIHNHHHLTRSAAESAALAVSSGCELNCGSAYQHLLTAVQEGLITEAEIDAALTRLFTARMRLGMFDPPEQVPYAQIPPEVVRCDAHVALTRQAARESMVLLKNEGNLLPLARDARSVAVVGPTALEMRPLLGNYYGFSPSLSTPLEGVIGRVLPGTQVGYHKGCSLAGTAAIDQGAVEFAIGDADVIVAVMGYSPTLEGEEGDAEDQVASEGGGDRLSIDLPGRQEELLQLLVATGKPVALVLTGGSAIAANWAAENVPAILMLWYPGEAGGEALADVLFGDACPGGRLPVTFPTSLDQLPPFEDYSMAGRTYRYMTDEPLYPFGFGLSYTRFEYGQASLSATEPAGGEDLTVSIEVTNSGDRAGDEVVQCYLTDVEASTVVPVRKLVGFTRVTLEPGEARTVPFTVTARQMALIDDAGKAVLEPGEFTVTVGGSQGDPRSLALGAAPVATAAFTVTGEPAEMPL